MSAAVPLVVFAIVLGVIFGAYWLFVVVPERRTESEVRARLKPARAQRQIAARLLKARERLSSIEALEVTFHRWTSWVQPLQVLISRAGLRTTVGTVVLGSIFIGVVVMAAVSMLTSSLIAAAILGPLFASAPFLYVRHKAAKRMASFEEKFPEVIDLIARALRAGHAFPTALKLVSEEATEPARSEFRLLFDQQNFGMSLPDALKGLAERIPLMDVRFFVTAVLTQREMGGNLSEVLDRLAHVIRERFTVKRHVRAVSAHGRITGVVLGFLPPAVAGVLMIISPAHIRLLSDDPIGVYMVIGAITLQIIGVMIMRKIVNVEF